MTTWLMRLSSATRSRPSGRLSSLSKTSGPMDFSSCSGFRSRSMISSSDTATSGSRNQNVEPSPTRLSTPISPPMRCTS